MSYKWQSLNLYSVKLLFFISLGETRAKRDPELNERRRPALATFSHSTAHWLLFSGVYQIAAAAVNLTLHPLQ